MNEIINKCKALNILKDVASTGAPLQTRSVGYLDNPNYKRVKFPKIKPAKYLKS